ncbi:oligosaccharide flippase family protein [Bradyrhizobium sp. AS23.2]|uniref:oligosaccharide flippase family protein n=1 Tax=Bradyrhizobium sp. AS23.2 TaxID=1680155 RepID=UPI0009FA4D1C|nr:oligosaccharide flippase family protein [Bradyrhizobium sp. AS23.2]
MNRRHEVTAGNHQIPLRRRVINASVWSLGGFGASQVIRFGGNLIMTRLLAPDMFGVMAVATVIMSTLAVFSDLGLKQSVIQSKRGSDPSFLNTIWTIQILRGFQLGLAALAVAIVVGVVTHYGWISTDSVYADPRVPYVIASVSVTAIITGFASTKVYQASRDLQIGKLTLIEVAAQIAGLASMLGWIAVDRSIWALVAGSISAATTSSCLSHFMLPGHKSRWEWNRPVIREIMQFGKWILLTSIVGSLIANLDRLLLAAMVDPTTLGIYAIAFNMFLSIEQLLMRVVAGIAYPAISEVVRNRPDNLKRAYYKIHPVVASLAYAATGFLGSFAPRLIALLYDARYADAGWMLQVLSIGLIMTPFQLALQTFMALNMPKINYAVAVLRLTLILVAMPAGFWILGLQGALVGLVLSSVACTIAILFVSAKVGILDAPRELLPLPAAAVGLIAGNLLSSIHS